MEFYSTFDYDSFSDIFGCIWTADFDNDYSVGSVRSVDSLGSANYR